MVPIGSVRWALALSPGPDFASSRRDNPTTKVCEFALEPIGVARVPVSTEQLHGGLRERRGSGGFLSQRRDLRAKIDGVGATPFPK